MKIGVIICGMKKRSYQKVSKKLCREKRHKLWLEKNLKNTLQLKNSKKRILKLYTELKVQNKFSV